MWEAIFWEADLKGFSEEIFYRYESKGMKDEKKQATWRSEWIMFQKEVSVSEGTR